MKTFVSYLLFMTASVWGFDYGQAKYIERLEGEIRNPAYQISAACESALRRVHFYEQHPKLEGLGTGP